MNTMGVHDPRSYRLEPRYIVLKNPEVHTRLPDEFGRWLVGQARPVSITPMRDIPALRHLDVEARQNECYSTATEIVRRVPGAVYVEGYLDYPPFRHAWNKIGEAYFDVTAKFHSLTSLKPIYNAVFLLGAYELAALQAGIKKVGAVARVFFLKNIYSKRGEIEPGIMPDFISSYCGHDD